MPVLAIVTPEEWRQRTSLRISRREPTLRKVDEAYDDYYQLRSPLKSSNLHNALEAYLKEKGGHWSRVERNKKSDGLMKYIYEKTGGGGSGDNVLSKRIPEARHGVLHLWQNSYVETQWVKILMEGALSIGGKALTAANGQISDDAKTWATVGGAGIAAAGIGVGVARGKGTASAPIQIPSPAPPAQPVPVAPLVELHRAPSNWEVIKQFLGDAFTAVYEKIRDFAHWVRHKVLSNSLAAIGALSKITEKVILYALNIVCKSMVPFVGAGIDIARGIGQAVSGAKARLSSYFARQKFVVAPGHPTMIADAIETQMNWAIGTGLFNTLKGGAKMAGNFFSAGASAIVDAIATGLEFIVKFFNRLAEGALMRDFISVVNKRCGDRGQWVVDPKDGVFRPAVCYNTNAFNKLFELGCEASACVPMMTLNSGICGDQMMFMKMFDDTSNGNVISQESFNAATGYFSRLKQFGRQYLQASGFVFTSPKRDVQGYMWHAVQHHSSSPTFGDAALKFVS